MKRWLTFLGILALSYCAFAEVYGSATFEALAVGAPIDTLLDDAGVTGYSYWYTDSDDKVLCTVKEYASGDGKYPYNEGAKIVDDGPGSKYLSINVEDVPLYRTLQANWGGGYIPKEASQMKAIGDGKVVDALMQFVDTNITGIPDLEAHDKMAVWLYTGDGATNLYVTAAESSGGDFNFKVDASVEPNSWHRITVRAIENIGNGSSTFSYARAGFTVYVDGVIVTADDADYDEAMSELDSAGLSPEAVELYCRHQLFISRVAPDQTEATKMLAAGLKGEGGVDDISIMDIGDAPSFVETISAFRLYWTKGVKSFHINGNPFTVPDDTASGSTNIVGATEIVISNIVYDTDDGYRGPDGYVFDISTLEGTVVATKGNFMIGDEGYEWLSAALEDAKDGDTIKMMADFGIDEENNRDGKEDGWWAGYVVDTGASITIDIAGHSLTGQYYDVLFDVNGELSICDSVGGGSMTLSPLDDLSPEYSPVFFRGPGTVNILYGGENQKLVSMDGAICDTEDAYDGSEGHGCLQLMGGYFTDDRVTNTVIWLYEDYQHRAYVADSDKDGYNLILLEDAPQSVELHAGSNGGFASKAAAEAAANNENIVPPAELGDGLKTYQDRFGFDFREESDHTWTILVKLTQEELDDLQAELEEDVKAITMAAIESRSASFTGTPGIWYRAIYGTEVGEILTPYDWCLSDAAGNVTLPLIKASDAAGFYRVQADADYDAGTAKAAND